jgi:L,D-peptidoglycan transpeptidase YkuD (ErfK/YbiS/YcfS/YnhG family)
VAPVTATTDPPPPAPTVPTTAGCAANLAAGLAHTAGASELITVQASTYDTTYATLTAWQREGSCWVDVYGPWTARIGAAGFSDHHHEGDNTTPTGAYGIGPVMYGNAPDPGVHYAYHQLVCGDWWDEDPASPDYNTFEHVPCGQTPPFGGGSEPLWQETNAYPSFAFIEYNTDPVVSGAGSAIFLHADVGSGTAGCVTLPLAELDDVLRWLNPADGPLVVMGPDSEIDDF